MKAKYDNLEMVLHVARKLGALLERVVFLGGSATGLLITDPDHSDDEDRFIILGLSSKLRELVVSFCERVKNQDEENIRIISARKADKDEREDYWRKRRI